MMAGAEYESIERELHIDATPDVVFDVISNPEHVREWWPDEAAYPAVAGGAGRIGFRQSADEVEWVEFQVVDAIPSRLFSFRWTHEPGDDPASGNSFLVVFELESAGEGTLLRMTETGFRQRGWSEAKAAAEHADHVSGWDFFLPRLPVYIHTLGARS